MRAKIAIIFTLVLILGSLLRFYQLGKIPPALDWDEASIGWNAYSLLTTGTDEYGNSHPVAIRSFNDYKPPLYVYSAIPAIASFGKSDFAVRLPSALFGTASIVLVYFLLLEFLKSHKSQQKFALTAMLISALNPWMIQFSRVAFEANAALTFFLLALLFLYKYVKNTKQFLLLLTSTVSFALSIYAYHSSRILVPLFAIGAFMFSPKIFLKQWKHVFLAVVLMALMLFPIARNAVRVGGLQARFDSVSIFTKKPSVEVNSTAGKVLANPLFYYSPIFVTNWLSNFNFNFLFLNADENPRHHAPDVGVLLILDFPLMLIGLYYLLIKRPAFSSWLIIWALASPVATALTTTSPHAIRSYALAPMFLLLSAYGLVSVHSALSRRLKIIGAIFVSLLMFANFLYFSHMYFVHMPVEFASGWQYGYKQVVQKVLNVEDNYDHIIISNSYDQPYIYFLFYGRIAPWIKNNGYFYQSMDKYSFGDPKSLIDLDKKYSKVLYVITPNDSMSKMKILSTVKFPNGAIAFELAERIK